MPGILRHVSVQRRQWPGSCGRTRPSRGRSLGAQPAEGGREPGPKGPRPAKPPAHCLGPLVYGVAAEDGAFFVRLGTRLYRVGGPAAR